ncbi:hypothetical protein EHQ13_16345 [Leptospira gomenensis]|uniref:Uncharacterized protein n=1 Tax=Leptospira gomenensis TaxID=2484974 RepID=A0A5F1YKI6_9LEPT|nr:DUF6615 family protein [Leptospira gomenensis]TGK38475.1 hypothetical protein EHQ17_02230 [Leptospira gomenensis]TGK42590.1 hypothetical protein EHQ07_14325 [Leptospira gomenensis]TGK55838.1 hypothetical protein EHQ13_16345 [Leptospira gomenensis]
MSLLSSQSVCNWSKEFSVETWERIEFAQSKKGFKIFETTITQDMLYNLAKLNLKGIKLFEAKNEKTNGNDLELFLRYAEKKYVRFCIQAKISYSNEEYRAIHHPLKNNTFQIQNLINYGSRKNSIPLYFFYSYTKAYQSIAYDQRGNKYGEFGISVTRADQIWLSFCNLPGYKFKSIPKVINIIDKHGITLHEFLCKRKIPIWAFLAFDNSDPDYRRRFLYRYFYDENELPEIDYWRQIDLADFSNFKSGRERSSELNRNQYEFNPCFRLIVDPE